MTFTPDPGQRVLSDLLALFHDKCGYVLGATNPVDLAFLEGQRSVVLAIKQMLSEYELIEKEEMDGAYGADPGATAAIE